MFYISPTLETNTRVEEFGQIDVAMVKAKDKVFPLGIQNAGEHLFPVFIYDGHMECPAFFL